MKKLSYLILPVLLFLWGITVIFGPSSSMPSVEMFLKVILLLTWLFSPLSLTVLIPLSIVLLIIILFKNKDISNTNRAVLSIPATINTVMPSLLLLNLRLGYIPISDLTAPLYTITAVVLVFYLFIYIYFLFKQNIKYSFLYLGLNLIIGFIFLGAVLYITDILKN